MRPLTTPTLPELDELLEELELDEELELLDDELELDEELELLLELLEEPPLPGSPPQEMMPASNMPSKNHLLDNNRLFE